MLAFMISYAVAINVIAWLSMGIDKQRARKRKYRISEKQLWVTTLLGGSTGTLLSMFMFRHKTRHKLFVAGVPFLFVIHLVLFFIVLVRFGG